jgi:hypothetical protein
MIESLIFWRIFDVTVVFIELLIFYIFVYNIKHANTTKKVRILSFISISGLSLLIRIANINPDLRVIVVIIFCTIFYKTNYSRKFIYCILNSLFFWALNMSFDLTGIGVVVFINNLESPSILLSANLYRLEAVLISKILLIFVILTLKFISKSKSIKIVYKDLIFITVPIFTNVICVLFLINGSIGFSGDTSIEIFIIVFICILFITSNISLFLISIKLIKDKKVILENEMQSKNEFMEYDYYVRIKDNSYKVRQLHHDMKNHLLCIASLCDNDEAKKYVNNLDFKINKLDNIFNTGNKVLDIILNEKKAICIENKIKLTTDIDFSKSDFIDTNDVCIIFANLLDNAIEACNKITYNKIEKIIDLKISYKKGFCIIKIINSKSNKINKSGNKILTDKKDKFLSGLGIQNIKEVVYKYQGELKIDFNESKFEITILIPILGLR